MGVGTDGPHRLGQFVPGQLEGIGLWEGGPQRLGKLLGAQKRFTAAAPASTSIIAA